MLKLCWQYYKDIPGKDIAHAIDDVISTMIEYARQRTHNKISNYDSSIHSPSTEYLIRNLKTSCAGTVQLVRTDDIEEYVDIDREYVRVGDIDYLNALSKQIVKDGLLSPIWMCVNKISGRAYIQDGNHRIAACKRLKVEWVPIYMTYKGCMYVNGKEFRFPKLPKLFVDGEWPENPAPAHFGFTTREFGQKVDQ